MITLAVATGISMTEWADWGERAITTAYEVLTDAQGKTRPIATG